MLQANPCDDLLAAVLESLSQIDLSAIAAIKQLGAVVRTDPDVPQVVVCCFQMTVGEDTVTYRYPLTAPHCAQVLALNAAGLSADDIANWLLTKLVKKLISASLDAIDALTNLVTAGPPQPTYDATAVPTTGACYYSGMCTNGLTRYYCTAMPKYTNWVPGGLCNQNAGGGPA